MNIRDEKIAIPIVLFAGLLWSFGPLVIRYANQPELVPWQYLFARGLVIFIILNFYLYLNEGKNFIKNYLKVGLSGAYRFSWFSKRNDELYLVYNTYFCCYYFALSCGNASYNSFARVYFFTRKNFN